jgi:hypothetical protein
MNIAILVLVFIAALCVMMVLVQQKRSETFLTPPRPGPMPSPGSVQTPMSPPRSLPPPMSPPLMPTKGPEAIASDFRTGYDDMLEFVPSQDAPDRKTFKVNTENPCDPYGTGTCFTRQ